MRGSINTAAAVMAPMPGLNTGFDGAGNGLFHGNAGLDFGIKVADLASDLGQAGCGMAFVDGKRLGLEPVQQARTICDQGTLATFIYLI